MTLGQINLRFVGEQVEAKMELGGECWVWEGGTEQNAVDGLMALLEKCLHFQDGVLVFNPDTRNGV